MGARNHPFSAKRRVSLITLLQIDNIISNWIDSFRRAVAIQEMIRPNLIIWGISLCYLWCILLFSSATIGVSSLFLSPPQGTRSCNDFWSLAKALCIFDRSSHPRIWFGPRKFSSQSQFQMFCILWSTALRDMHPIRSPVKPKLHPHLCPINHSSLQSLGQGQF